MRRLAVPSLFQHLRRPALTALSAVALLVASGLMTGAGTPAARAQALPSLGDGSGMTVAAERALPFDVRVPNAETAAAIRELEAGQGARLESIDDLLADLNADD